MILSSMFSASEYGVEGIRETKLKIFQESLYAKLKMALTKS